MGLLAHNSWEHPTVPADTGTPNVIPSLEVARETDREAWNAYGKTCHNPLASEEQRRHAFLLALDSLTAIRKLEALSPSAVAV